MSDLYYLQDNRSYVGNDILFWAKDGSGYTTDISKAETYTKEDAISHHQSRESDVPWPKDYIDARTRPAVDMQYVEIELALKGTGIELIKPKPYKKPVYHCGDCGVFQTERQHYGELCGKCGASNQP